MSATTSANSASTTADKVDTKTAAITDDEMKRMEAAARASFNTPESAAAAFDAFFGYVLSSGTPSPSLHQVCLIR